MAVTGVELQFLITGDNRSAMQALQQTETQAQSTATNLNATLSQVLIGRTLENWGDSLLGFSSDFVTAGADFQQSIQFINRLTSSTADGFDELQNKAITLARTSIFSAQDIVDGMEQLAREGFNVSQIVDGGFNSMIDASVNMATALGTSIPDSANMIGQLERVFADQGLSAGQVADIVTQAVLRSGQGLAQFAGGLQYVAAQADMTNTPLAEVASMVSYLESELIRGRNAGTSLRTMFQNLQAPTGAVADELAKLGVNTIDANGEFIGIKATIGLLHDAYGNLSTAQQEQANKTLFGAYATSATLELIRGGIPAMDAYAAKEADVGSAADIAHTKMNNLAGSLHNFTSSIFDVKIVLGEAVSGVLKPFVDLANKLIGIFLFMPEPVHLVAGVLIILAGALAAVTGAIILFNAVGGMEMVAASISAALGIIGTSIDIFVPELWVVVAVLAAAVVIFEALGLTLGNVQDKWTTFWKVFDGTRANDPKNWHWGELASTIDAFGNAIKYVFGQNALSDWLNRNAIAVQDGIDLYNRLTTKGVNPLAAALESLGFVLTGSGLAGLGNFLVGLGKDLDTFTQVFDKFRSGGVDPLTSALYALSAVFESKGLTGLADWFGILGDAVDAFVQGDYSGALSDFTSALDTLLSTLSDLGTRSVHVALDVALDVAGDLKTWAGDLWGWVKMKLLGNSASITPGQGTSGAAIVGTEPISVGTAFINAALKLAGDAYTASLDFAGWLKTKITGNWNRTIEFGAFFLSGVPGLATALLVLHTNFPQWLRGQLTAGWNGVVELGQVLLDATPVIGNVLRSVSSNIGAWLWGEIKGGWDHVVAMGDVTFAAVLADFHWAASGLGGLVQGVFGWGPWIWAQVKGGWNSVVNMGDVAMHAALDKLDSAVGGWQAASKSWGVWIWNQVKGAWDNTVQIGAVTLNGTLDKVNASGGDGKGKGGGFWDFSGWASSVKDAAVGAIDKVADFGSAIASAIGQKFTDIKDKDWTTYITKDSFNFGVTLGDAVHDNIIGLTQLPTKIGEAIGDRIKNINWDTVWNDIKFANTVATQISDQIDTVKKDAGGVLLGAMTALGSAMLGFLAGAILGKENVDQFTNFIANLITGIANEAVNGDYTGAAKDIASGLWNAVISWFVTNTGIKDIVDAITGNGTTETGGHSGDTQATGNGSITDPNGGLGSDSPGLFGPGSGILSGDANFDALARNVGSDVSKINADLTRNSSAFTDLGAKINTALNNIGHSTSAWQTSLQTSFTAVTRVITNFANQTQVTLGTWATRVRTTGQQAGSQFESQFDQSIHRLISELPGQMDQVLRPMTNLAQHTQLPGQQAGGNFRNGIVSALQNAVNAVIGQVNQILYALQLAFSRSDPYSIGFGLGADYGQGFADGIASKAGAAAAEAAAMANNALNTVRNVGAVASPSKKMMELGNYYVDGFLAPFLSRSRDVTNAIVGMIGLAAPHQTAVGAGAHGGYAVGGNVQNISVTNHITVPAANFPEWIKTVEFVQGLGRSRQMVKGTP